MPHYLELDLGNSDGKSLQVGKRHVQVLQHGLRVLSMTEWDIACSRAESQRNANDTKIFMMDNVPVQVGKKAADSGAHAPKSGPSKYSKHYFRFIAAAQMMCHFPKGTNKEHIHLSVAHPPDAVPYRDDLKNSLGGVYNIKDVFGNKIRFAVKSVVAHDEASGGIMRFLATNQEELSPNENMLVIDIGGRVSSMTEVEVYKYRGQWQLDIKYDERNRSTVFYMGILDVYEALESELVSLHGDLVRNLQPLKNHRDLIQTTIKTKGQFPIFGGKEFVDVSQAYQNSVGRFEAEFLQNYDKVNNGTRNSLIVKTGGGTAALSQFLLQHSEYNQDDPDNWLKHPYVDYADAPAEIRSANARGGATLFHEDLIRRGLLEG